MYLSDQIESLFEPMELLLEYDDHAVHGIQLLAALKINYFFLYFFKR